MKKDKKRKEQPEIRQLTPEELAEEERKYQACKKPVKIGWHIYGFAALAYILNGIFTQSAVAQIPQQQPLSYQLNEYKHEAAYTDFIAEAQKDALKRLENGEITIEEYEYVIETISSDKKFEEFLRTLKDNEYVQEKIAEYDEYTKQVNNIGKKYRALSLTSLGSLVVGTIILGKYRFREMDIEEARKKRNEALNNNNNQMQ